MVAVVTQGCASLKPGPSFPASPVDPGYAGASLPDGDAMFLTELTALVGSLLGGVFLSK